MTINSNQDILETIKELLKTKYEISALSNVVSYLFNTLDNLDWIGIYYCNQRDNELFLGPFQGSIACEVIEKGKGICGQSWNDDRVIVVSDVRKETNYISCSASTLSELVIPIHKDGVVYALLDIDSDKLNRFDSPEIFIKIVKLIELQLDKYFVNI
jgi:GAF domain-containing protein